ncbi:MAG: hypothetical protein FRX49_11744 [Trebouxia sp. A1-2]|nr:MAG: hypothetical protein FRX49_11744 [Trebouxia sp. A1-2]
MNLGQQGSIIRQRGCFQCPAKGPLRLGQLMRSKESIAQAKESKLKLFLPDELLVMPGDWSNSSG